MFDIGKNISNLDDDSDEMKFYLQQKTSREGKIAEEIDEEYEREQAAKREQINELKLLEEAEEQFIMQEEQTEVLNSTINGQNTSHKQQPFRDDSCKTNWR